MKIEELKIGDWVSYDGKPVKVINFIVDILRCVSDYSIFAESYSASCVEPIPLTKEILEKNGWKKDDDGAYVIKDLIFLSKDDFGGWTVGISEDYVLTISFVHQLQHILWALGIDDDLKV